MGFDFRNPFARDKTTTSNTTETRIDTGVVGDTKATNTEWTGTTYGMAASAATALSAASLCFLGANRYSIANSFGSNAPSFRNTVLSTAANNTVLLASTALFSTAIGIGLWLHSRPDTEDSPKTDPGMEESSGPAGGIESNEEETNVPTRTGTKKSLNNARDRGGKAGRELGEARQREHTKREKEKKEQTRRETEASLKLAKEMKKKPWTKRTWGKTLDQGRTESRLWAPFLRTDDKDQENPSLTADTVWEETRSTPRGPTRPGTEISTGTHGVWMGNSTGTCSARVTRAIEKREREDQRKRRQRGDQSAESAAGAVVTAMSVTKAAEAEEKRLADEAEKQRLTTEAEEKRMTTQTTGKKSGGFFQGGFGRTWRPRRSARSRRC